MSRYKLASDDEWQFLQSINDSEDGEEARILHVINDEVVPLVGNLRVPRTGLVLFRCEFMRFDGEKRDFQIPVDSTQQFQVRRKARV